MISVHSEPQREKNYATTVAISFLWSEEEVLILQRARPPFEKTWCLPGGKVEEGETEAEGLSRELTEEVQLVIAPDDFTFRKRYYCHFKSWDYILSVYAFSLSERPEIGLSEEHIAFQWIGHLQFPQVDLIPGGQTIFGELCHPPSLISS